MSTSEPFKAAAYGGPGWSPRTQTTKQELGTVWQSCGIDSESDPLRAVILHQPGDELRAAAAPNSVQMIDVVDSTHAAEQHAELASAYRRNGIDVHYIDPATEPSPNQMFAADLFFMTPEGAILARPASTVRAGEERWLARRLADLGVPILCSVHGRGTFEGADAMWLDRETVIIGCGFRTNDDGARQVSAALREMGVETITVDMSVGAMHLMGMLRIVAPDLAIAWPKRFVHRGWAALKERGYTVEWLPDLAEVEQRKAFNIVTLAPRKIMMPGGCPVTQAFFESLDIECVTVAVDELAKAAGAIGCLTGVLHRAA